jgi:hypothetical protein
VTVFSPIVRSSRRGTGATLCLRAGHSMKIR